MPREIIDVQSSRPRYVRRVALTTALALAALAALLVVVFFLWGRPGATQAGSAGRGTHGPARAVPGK